MSADTDTETTRFAKVGGVDIDGILRGKLLPIDKLEDMIKCDQSFGWYCH